MSSGNEASEPNVKQNRGDIIRASWNFSLDNIRTNTSAYEPKAQQALASAFLWCIDPLHPIAKPEFAKRVKCSDNLLYKLYTGTYQNEKREQLHPSPELIKNIQAFLALEKERYSVGETQFVLTPTAQTICTACHLARESQTIVFVVGPSHVGKTWATERYYTPNNNHGRTIYVRMHAASGLGGMVRAIAAAVGISPNGNTADLIHRIKGALTKDMLLILDEVHLLAHTYRAGSFHNCMEVIREFHDVKKTGIVLLFTILDAVKAASQKELQQLWRRGVHKVILPGGPTKGDLAAIIKHNGLPGEAVFEGKLQIGVFPAKDLRIQIRADSKTVLQESPYDILRQVSKEDGLLAITERIRYARKLANKANQKIDWNHFVDAHLRIAKNATPINDWN